MTNLGSKVVSSFVGKGDAGDSAGHPLSVVEQGHYSSVEGLLHSTRESNIIFTDTTWGERYHLMLQIPPGGRDTI